MYMYSCALLEAFPVVDAHNIYKVSILEKEGRKLLHFGLRGEKKQLNFNHPVELQLTTTIASLLQRSGIFVKSVGGTDETDNSESF